MHMPKNWRYINYETVICRLAGKRQIRDVTGKGLVVALEAQIPSPDHALERVYLAHLLVRGMCCSRALDDLRAPDYSIEARNSLEGLQRLIVEQLDRMPTGDAAGT